MVDQREEVHLELISRSKGPEDENVTTYLHRGIEL